MRAQIGDHWWVWGRSGVLGSIRGRSGPRRMRGGCGLEIKGVDQGSFRGPWEVDLGWIRTIWGSMRGRSGVHLAVWGQCGVNLGSVRGGRGRAPSFGRRTCAAPGPGAQEVGSSLRAVERQAATAPSKDVNGSDGRLPLLHACAAGTALLCGKGRSAPRLRWRRSVPNRISNAM